MTNNFFIGQNKLSSLILHSMTLVFLKNKIKEVAFPIAVKTILWEQSCKV